MMMTTTFNTKHEIPMDKITYDLINNSRRDLIHKLAHDLIDSNLSSISIAIQIRYDEELQLAYFESYFPFSMEQTSEYFILTMDDYDELPNYYFINKKTGEFSKHVHNRKCPYRLLDGLVRVYGLSERELLESDFISDRMKRHIEVVLWEREEDNLNDF